MSKNIYVVLSEPMAQAKRDGRKAMTRRLVKPQPDHDCVGFIAFGNEWLPQFVDEKGIYTGDTQTRIKCPYGQAGDTLMGKEAWATEKKYDDLKPSLMLEGFPKIHYMADGPKPGWCGKTRFSMFMCEWMVRNPEVITSIRLERLQDISEEDAIAEGIGVMGTPKVLYKNYLNNNKHNTVARLSFASLWESINGEGSWDRNDWVWVIEWAEDGNEKQGNSG